LDTENLAANAQYLEMGAHVCAGALSLKKKWRDLSAKKKKWALSAHFFLLVVGAVA